MFRVAADSTNRRAEGEPIGGSKCPPWWCAAPSAAGYFGTVNKSLTLCDLGISASGGAERY